MPRTQHKHDIAMHKAREDEKNRLSKLARLQLVTEYVRAMHEKERVATLVDFIYDDRQNPLYTDMELREALLR